MCWRTPLGFSKRIDVFACLNATILWFVLLLKHETIEGGQAEVCYTSTEIRIFLRVIACLMWSSQVPTGRNLRENPGVLKIQVTRAITG